jgi:hypothetical protein
MLTGLVRVVAQDGSVWWTRPEHVESHAALTSATVPADWTPKGFELYGGK